LSWHDLDAYQRSGRWDVQLRAWTGDFLIDYGRGRGPFHAYRGDNETIASWRERVFGDITAGERLLARYVRGYRPLAFSPPYGNYGQAGTNDPEIPRLLFARLHADFPVILTQDHPAPVPRGAGTARPIGRYVDRVPAG
jgi:hypothetical protein